MAFQLPNWMRFVLTILSILSYLPQQWRMWSRGNCQGISLYCVLFNLISATEQFAISFFLVVGANESDIFVHSPLTRGDWLNMYQFAAVWVLSLAFFIACLYYPSDIHRGHKATAVAIYTTFLLVAVAPILYDIFTAEPDEWRNWLVSYIAIFHTFMLTPTCTLLNIVAIFSQARKLQSSAPSGALSLTGLAVQAVVFALVALSFLGRVNFPYPFADYVAEPGGLAKWFCLVGWAAADNGIFAIGQAVLLWVAARRTGSGDIPSGETQPLLGSES